MKSAAATHGVRAHGAKKLARLCDAIGFGEDKATALQLFELLSESWGDQPLERAPAWRSAITDDHSPCEFSLAFDGDHCEVRFLLEVQAQPMTLPSSWAAGLAACERLHQQIATPLHRLRVVEDLFAPTDPEASFSLWHAICVRHSEPPDVKVYLNPNAHGLAASRALVEEALGRLGLSKAWRYLADEVMRPEDRLAYFSLDLSPHPWARVKIYLGQPGMTADEAERLLATDSGYRPGVAKAFYQSVLGGDGPFERRPPGTCLAFTEQSDGRPYTTTLYLPPSDYVEDDRQTASRIYQHLDPKHRRTLQAALEAVAERPLEAGVGLIQWVSLKRRNGQNRVTTYISPETYQVMPPRSR